MSMESNTGPETSNEARIQATDMSVKVLSTEIIKPSNPTPDHRRSFTLSLFDQLTPVIYTPIILYYPTRDHDPLLQPSLADNLRRLRSSLSVVLSRFYPLAGRIKDNLCIECNDRGAKFLEAKVNCELSEVLARPSPQLLRLLLPAQVESLEARTGHLLLVQANSFECGGLAVGICVSHKVADASAMSTFIKSWADVANEIDLTNVESLELNASSLIPPLSHLKTPPEVKFLQRKTVMRRYSFDSSSLVALVGEIMSEDDHGLRPTRLEALSALLWKCLMETSRRIRGRKRRSFFSHIVNLRGRMPQPFPKDGMSLGNLLGGFRAEITEDDEEIHLVEMARRLRLAKEDYLENFVRNEMVGEKTPAAVLGDAKAFGELLSDPEVDFYNCSSWCKFPFYEADFGWGKPVWVSMASAEFKDAILMIDGMGGDGIEVWLSLERDHMVELEREEDLLRFASPNSSITW